VDETSEEKDEEFPREKDEEFPREYWTHLAVFDTIMMEYNLLIIDEVLYLYVGANTPK